MFGSNTFDWNDHLNEELNALDLNVDEKVKAFPRFKNWCEPTNYSRSITNIFKIFCWCFDFFVFFGVVFCLLKNNFLWLRKGSEKISLLEFREVEGSLLTFALATSNAEALSQFFQFHFNSSLEDDVPSHISFCERFLFRETKIIQQQSFNDL